MDQLICHLIGDYILQNHWMAQNKTKAWIPALIHATTYILPFLLLNPTPTALLTIWSTHLIIDRYRLAHYWVEFYGIGNTGTFWMIMKHDRMPWETGYDKIPPKERAPEWLTTWLLIIVDNTIHLTINYTALTWL